MPNRLESRFKTAAERAMDPNIGVKIGFGAVETVSAPWFRRLLPEPFLCVVLLL